MIINNSLALKQAIKKISHIKSKKIQLTLDSNKLTLYKYGFVHSVKIYTTIDYVGEDFSAVLDYAKFKNLVNSNLARLNLDPIKIDDQPAPLRYQAVNPANIVINQPITQELKLALLCLPQYHANHAVTNARFEFKNLTLTLTSTDGYKLSNDTIPVTNPMSSVEDIYLDIPIVKTLIDHNSNQTIIELYKHEVTIRIKNTIIVSHRLDLKYPNIDLALSGNKLKQMLDPQLLLTEAKRTLELGESSITLPNTNIKINPEYIIQYIQTAKPKQLVCEYNARFVTINSRFTIATIQNKEYK